MTPGTAIRVLDVLGLRLNGDGTLSDHDGAPVRLDQRYVAQLVDDLAAALDQLGPLLEAIRRVRADLVAVAELPPELAASLIDQADGPQPWERADPPSTAEAMLEIARLRAANTQLRKAAAGAGRPSNGSIPEVPAAGIDRSGYPIAHCTWCIAREPMIWTTTAATGARMPVNAEPDPVGLIELIPPTEPGAPPKSIVRKSPPGPGDSWLGYVAHHATCKRDRQRPPPPSRRPRST